MIVNMPEITKERHSFKLAPPQELANDGFGVWWLFSDEKATSAEHAKLLRTKPNVICFREPGLENDLKNVTSVHTYIEDGKRRFEFVGEMKMSGVDSE